MRKLNRKSSAWKRISPDSCRLSTRRGFPLLGVLAILGAGFFLASLLPSCSGDNKGQEKTRPAIPVTVATAVQKDVPVQLRVIGKVEAYSAVSIRALVEGELAKVYFTEGQDVQKDHLLVTIDPRPFEARLRQAEANLERDHAVVMQAEANLTRDLAQVSQAEANLAKNQAQAKNAEEQAKRYAFLAEKGYVAKEQHDQVRTNWESLAASVQADKAAVENAQATLGADKAALEMPGPLSGRPRPPWKPPGFSSDIVPSGPP